MTIRHFKIFKAVCDEENLTRAAEKLYMTQPAVSRAIGELEREAGCALFDRLSHRLCLNASGKLFYQKVSRVLDLYSELEGGAGEWEWRAPIRLGSSITIANYWLPPMLKRFSLAYPKTRVHVNVERAQEVTNALTRGELDLALIEGALPGERLESRVFSRYEIVAVASPEHPLADCGAVPPERLLRETLLLRERGSAIRDTLDSALLLRSLTAEPSWTSVNSQALMQAARHGLGITFLPDILVKEDLSRGSLVRLPIEGMTLCNENALVWHRDKEWSAPMRALQVLLFP